MPGRDRCWKGESAENEGMGSHRDERGGCRKESGLSRWESKGPLLPQRKDVSGKFQHM